MDLVGQRDKSEKRFFVDIGISQSQWGVTKKCLEIDTSRLIIKVVIRRTTFAELS